MSRKSPRIRDSRVKPEIEPAECSRILFSFELVDSLSGTELGWPILRIGPRKNRRIRAAAAGASLSS